MLGLRLLFLLLLVLLALAVARGLWGAVRFRRRFDHSSAETAKRLREHLETQRQPDQDHS